MPYRQYVGGSLHAKIAGDINDVFILSGCDWIEVKLG
jgi:hypothetical protein